MINTFKIDNTEFNVDTKFKDTFVVNSHPTSYDVRFDSYKSVVAASYLFVINY